MRHFRLRAEVVYSCASCLAEVSVDATIVIEARLDEAINLVGGAGGGCPVGWRVVKGYYPLYYCPKCRPKDRAALMLETLEAAKAAKARKRKSK